MIEQPMSHPDPTQLEAAKLRIREILAELKASAKKTDVDESQFLHQLLSRTTETTAANGVIIWQLDSDGTLSTVGQLGSTVVDLELGGPDRDAHDRFIRTSIDKTQGMVIDPNARSAEESSLVNATPYLLLIHPLGETVAGRQFAIELFQRPDINAVSRTGYLRFLNEIGEIYISWRSRMELKHRQMREQKSQRVLDFIRDVHSSLNPRFVGYTAANDGRALFDCDRLTVLSFDSRRARVLAVSGQDNFDNRSNVVQKQQRLASLVCRHGRPIWLSGPASELPRGLQREIDNYQNEAHARTLAVIPLNRTVTTDSGTDEGTAATEQVGDALGALILEWFTLDVPRHERQYELEVVTENVAHALENANTHQSIFLLSLWKFIGKWRWLVKAKTLPKTMIAMAALIGLVAFLTLFPYPLDMRVDGQLQPAEQYNVYANIDGIVTTVHVENAQKVAKGDLLISLRNEELRYQIASAQGQLNEIEQEILSTKAAALRTPESEAVDQSDEATARIRSLLEQQASIKQQLEILNRRQEKLNIHSPINGTIVSWDPVRQLTERPVSRQDVVLVIADVESDWELELYIPERKYGHVTAAGDKPKITFFAATDPQHRFQGQIQRIEGHAAEREGHGSVVRAIASFDQNQAPELYVGAAVTAKIHCGTSSIGYAWFHELAEFVQSRILF